MPHKKNPITCERLSGIARIIRGNTLAAFENIALWHERDISHSSVERVILPDSTTLVDYALVQFTNIVKNIVVNRDNIKRNLELTTGLVFSQTLLLKLIDKKMRREDAYRIVQNVAMKSWANRENFRDLVSKDQEVMKYITAKELESVFDYNKSAKNVDFIFKRVGI
jgi:adenylosuccinate lyase